MEYKTGICLNTKKLLEFHMHYIRSWSRDTFFTVVHTIL